MKKLSTLFLLTLFYQFSAADITVTINSPSQNQVVLQNTLNLDVSTVSDYDLKSVIATINGQNDTLTSNGTIGSYTSTWILNGVPTGIPLTLTVTAIDYFNNQQSSSVSVVFPSSPPVVNTPQFPIEYSNIYPSLHLKDSYSGGDNVTFTVTVTGTSLSNYGNQLLNFTISNNVDTVINFQNGSDGYVNITYTATDKWGQQSSATTFAFYDDNPLINIVYQGKGTIWDFNYNKVLEYYPVSQLTDLSTRTSISVPNGAGRITPYGVLYSAGLFDWNADTTYVVPDISYTTQDSTYMLGGSTIFDNSGKYAASSVLFQNAIDPNSSYINIYLYNLQTHTSSLYATSQGNNYYYILGSNPPSVSADMDVDSSGYIQYVSNPLIDDDFGHAVNMAPKTDNYNHAYVSAIPIIDSMIELYEGGYHTFLVINNSTTIDLGTPGPSTYLLSNKFIAYEKTGVSGTIQVWLRDSLGNDTQLTFSGKTNSTLLYLTPNGDVVYNTGNTGYLAKKGSTQPINLGSLGGGALYYRDSTWYEAEGAVLYKLLVDAYIPVSNGDWNNPSTWNNNMVPPSNADVVINNFNVTVTADASCNSLKVIKPGTITVLPGVNLTILH